MSRRADLAFLLTILGALGGGCAASAPPLPPDTTATNRTGSVTIEDFEPADRALACADIERERETIKASTMAANARVAGHRSTNQVAGYFGAFFPPILLATEGDYDEKDELVRLQSRRDTLSKLAVLKNCPMVR